MKKTKKIIQALLSFFLINNFMFAQSDDDLFFSDDDFFTDDTITEVNNVSAATNLSKGVLYETGNIKLGGSFNMGLKTVTLFSDDIDAGESFEKTLLIPTANAELNLDTHPLDNLRFYMKAGVRYPYKMPDMRSLLKDISYMDPSGGTEQSNPVESQIYGLGAALSSSSLGDYFYIKELFTDFNLGENIACRFGKQTVSWGVGYFYSPADVINLQAIDPQNPEAQREGPLAFRTQVVFSGTQNAIWAYVIPDAPKSLSFSWAKDIAFAAKGEMVFGGWELGLGAWCKNERAPRIVTTATGTLFKYYGVFAEGVMAIGKDNILENQWKANSSGKKDLIFQGTAGFMRLWKDNNIVLATQYYYNQQEVYEETLDGKDIQRSLSDNYGHNLAISLIFGKLKTTDLNLALLGMYNFNNENGLASLTFSYNPIKELKFSIGPYFVFNKDNSPKCAAVFSVDLGSGKF